MIENRKNRNRVPRTVFRIGSLLLSFLCFASPPAIGEDAPPPAAPPAMKAEFAALESPAPGSSVVARKPKIRVVFLEKVDPAAVSVFVDGTDYSAVAAKSASGIDLTPPLPLPAGAHQVTVLVADPSGVPRQFASSFSSRHFETVDELTSRNDLTGLYEVALHKPSSQDNAANNAREEANLTSSTLVRKGAWSLGFDGNARYRDQSLPISAPERQGIDLVSWTAKAGFRNDSARAEAAVGDVSVPGTPLTIASLARKGATLSAEAGPATILGFSVRGQSVYGTRGGLSLDGPSSSHIRGGSAGLRLLENRLSFKAVFLDGGEPAGAFNTGTTLGNREGSAGALQATTDFFGGRFRTDMEVAFSRYNPDTGSAASSSSNDHAFRIGASGASGIASYDAAYEFVGRDYQVVGNAGIARNRQTFRAGGGVNLGSQTIGATVSRQNDDVRDDPGVPTNVDWQAGLQYGLNAIAALPMSFSAQWGRQRAEGLPAGQESTLDRETRALNGNATWILGPVSTAFQGNWTEADDRTPADADTTAWGGRIAPSFSSPGWSLTPSGAFSRAETGGSRTDTTTLGLDCRAAFLETRVTAEAGGGWSSIRNDSGSQNGRNLQGNLRLAYNFAPMLSGYFRPSAAARATWLHVTDRANPALGRDEWTVFLTVTAQVPVVL